MKQIIKGNLMYGTDNPNYKHGMTGTRIYKSWEMMKNRCLNKNYTQYKDYGGRGITICPEWMNFQNFYNDMGERPIGKTLDRRNNNGNYCKENCKWSTRIEQQNNTRYNHLITYKGRTQNIKQWSEEIGIEYETLLARIKYYNWSIEKALTTPRQINQFC